ncbi:MAG: hypothetical protein ACTMUB_00245 [cyanobacterium endosymbiont of Rhopalodia musculus]|uniref:hypothetical protein n=1 Tax=cyanobacterium endosymbiont of Epithemia clementina EcSB TaxID=3034674 RepID=UPI002480BBCB|nr:hypothetical protein [cyanobacterium endosymbiont of Epithemia clementina EcSB]WGT66720.1 hypothetical protein P3F56_05480 [cyanobacterium endosymbiont of Epithemia clementina EcSB]
MHGRGYYKANDADAPASLADCQQQQQLETLLLVSGESHMKIKNHKSEITKFYVFGKLCKVGIGLILFSSLSNC